MTSYGISKGFIVIITGVCLSNFLLTGSHLALSCGAILVTLLMALLFSNQHEVVAKYTKVEAKHKHPDTKRHIWSDKDYATFHKYLIVFAIAMGIFSIYYSVDIATGGEPAKISRIILKMFGVKGFVTTWMTISILSFYTAMEMMCYLYRTKRPLI